MSCQSLAAARAFSDSDKNIAQCSGFHRSVKFSPDARSSTRSSHNGDKREAPGSSSMLAISLTPIPQSHAPMSQSAPAHHSILLDGDASPPPCRFPKLEECAHFHYDRVSLPPLSVRTERCDHEHCARADDPPADEGWICLTVSTASDAPRAAAAAGWSDAGDAREWRLTRSAANLRSLDDMLHRCIYDRRVSNLPDLRAELTPALLGDRTAYVQLVADYFHHFTIIADNSINCGPILNWLQMDNKGHKLLVANEDSSSINTPAVAAAYSVRKYVSQARDEISFEVGDMISIIDMPGPQESTWWRGKRGFRVGFFPHHCVSVIGDKAPRHMAQPPRVVGSLAVTPIKPVLRKHGKLISLFRSFILSRPSRRALKQQGILRERVFGCDLGEHLMNCQQDVPVVLSTLATVLESRGAVDGVYRLSGGSTLTQRLRAEFDEGKVPDLDSPAVRSDPHALASLLKTYFRELPNPLCTYQLYDAFVSAAQTEPARRVQRLRETVAKLPPPHYRTLSYLTQHLQRVSLLGAQTGMTARNMAIVWAPNLLRPRARPHALQGVAQQAVITEMLICYASQLFSESPPDAPADPQPEVRGGKPTSCTTHLLSLEEAQRRGKPPAPIAAIEIPSYSQLQTEAQYKPKYIEVGSGPNNLPQYHTVLELPAPGKRGLKRSPSGWRGLFSRAKLQRAPRVAPPVEVLDAAMPPPSLRPVKSCESLQSDGDTVAPLAAPPAAPLKQHARSSSCDSYFEPWQWELWDMRLRLSPQERDQNMFSEEEPQVSPESSARATPALSPRRDLRIELRPDSDAPLTTLESTLPSLRYIDAGSPRAAKGTEKRPARPAPDAAKRLCKDRESPSETSADSQPPVKLRERTSPRKARASARYSGLHHPLSSPDRGRLSWHGRDGHATLIRVDWPPRDPPEPPSPPYDPLTPSDSGSSPCTDSKDELDESRPSYVHLQSSPSRCSASPRSPLKSTISITFRSPSRGADDEETPRDERDSLYETLDLEKSLSIVEDASVPDRDACLPTQQACQPAGDNLVILETPTETENQDIDVYSQVKFFRKSIDEVNALLDEKDKERHYENVNFTPSNDAFAAINVDKKLADLDAKLNATDKASLKLDVGTNAPTLNLKVKELKTRFESPTEVKGQLQFKAEIKYEDKPKSSNKSVNTRSLDENAFVQEFGPADRRKSLEVAKDSADQTPNLDLNLDHESPITPTSENKLSLIQRFDKPAVRTLMESEDKKLSRERIEKYKEERRLFLREKYASQSFRSNPDNLTRIKVKREPEVPDEEQAPGFVRRNTLDLGQRSRFSLAKSVNSIDSMNEPESPEAEASKYGTAGRKSSFVRKEKASPSYNIRDMAALFEQKSQNAG